MKGARQIPGVAEFRRNTDSDLLNARGSPAPDRPLVPPATPELPAYGRPMPRRFGVPDQAGEMKDYAARHMPAEMESDGVTQSMGSRMTGVFKISLLHHPGLSALVLS